MIFLVIFLFVVFLLAAIFANNTVVKVITGALTGINLLLIIGLGYLHYQLELKPSEVDRKESPTGEYVLILDAVGEPAWPFGPASGKLVLKKNKKTVKKLNFQIANDGGNIGKDSWLVSWKDDNVEVILSGCEQPDEKYVIYFDDRMYEKEILNTKFGKEYE